MIMGRGITVKYGRRIGKQEDIEEEFVKRTV
jgi:hypothetical protein